MKKAFAAFLIGVICLTVLAVHAWWTWDEASSLRIMGDRDFFAYSLFLESFAFMVSAAYFVGPRIYRFFGEAEAAVKFAGEKERVSTTVHIYSAITVVVRRLWFDHQAGISFFETLVVVSLILAPAVLSLVRRRRDQPQKKINQAREPTAPGGRGSA